MSRIIIVSDPPTAISAYAQQTAVAAPLLAAGGHTVIIYAPAHIGSPFFYQSPLHTQAIMVVGGRDLRVPSAFGSDMIAPHAERLQADMVITMKDPHAFELANLRELEVPWIPICPIDTLEVAHNTRDMLSAAFRVIAVSHHGQRALRDAGRDSTLIPHGIDLNIFKPSDQQEARKKLGLPADAFLALIVADNHSNPSRKNFEHIISAWSLFLRHHPDALLLFHTDMSPDRGGLDLQNMLQEYGVPEINMMLSDQYQYVSGFKREHLAALYRAANVLLMPSLGEGFGLPLIEAQACGTAVIATDVTAMTEHVANGILIAATPQNGDRVLDRPGGMHFRASAYSIYQALMKFMNRPKDQKVRQHQVELGLALAAQFDQHAIMQNHWLPFLAEVDGWIKEAQG